MSCVAEPASVWIVTTVALSRVPPFSVALTVNVLAGSSSSRESGSTLRAMPVRASSSVMVVVTLAAVPRLATGPPPPVGLSRETVNVSSASISVSSVVWTVNVWEPAAV